MLRIITKKQCKAIDNLIYKLELENENLSGVNKLLNERIEILENRNKDLIKENTILKNKEAKHE